jgi:broad specificity phosphatase PhoE
MTRPIDLVLVRHGESEGNVAHSRAKRGDSSLFSDEYLDRPSAHWRLTKRGRRQAVITGNWIRGHIATHFDRYYVSPYYRTLETAALLELDCARWTVELFLRERDWDDADGVPSQAGRQKRENVLKLQRDDLFIETLSQFYLRVESVLRQLNEKSPNERVVVVAHHEVMWAVRTLLEGLPHEELLARERSGDPHHRLHNAQVLHYTRRHPDSGVLKPEFQWVRSVLPENPQLSSNIWREFQRPTFSDLDLLQIVRQVEPIIE